MEVFELPSVLVVLMEELLTSVDGIYGATILFA